MSIHWINVVKKSTRRKGSGRLVLLAMADYANEEGICWPSIGSIATWANISEKQTRRIVHKLEDAGEIEILETGGGTRETRRGRKGKSNLYQLHEKVILLPPIVLPSHTGEGTSPPKSNSKPSHPEDIPSQKDVSPPIIKGGDPLIESPIKSNPQEEPPISKRDFQNAIRKELEETFKSISGLPIPLRKSEAGELWYAPIREIAILADWDLEVGKWLMHEAYLRLMSENLTIASPKSIIKTVRFVKSLRDRGNLQSMMGEPKGFKGVREWLQRSQDGA